MTKKDFELLAAALHGAEPMAHGYPSNPQAEYQAAYGAWRLACRHVAHALATTNPRFDRDRFLQACGVAS